MAPPKLKVGAAGLGRMGRRHALNFLNRNPRAELVAAFSPDLVELEWAKQNLEPYGVTLYDDYDEMIRHPGVQAIVIGTATSVHAEESTEAMERNLHVLCEKRLSISIEVQVVAEAKKRPHLKKLEEGFLGRPDILRSQTCDEHDPSGFFVAYAAWSGGFFVDMSVHDIDLMLWFFGDNVIPKSISAHGVKAVQPELAQYSDYDNAVGIVEFHGEDTTEAIGTEGKLSINAHPTLNHVQQYHAAGITRDVPQHYYDRFGQAFVKETNELTDACFDGTPLSIKLTNAFKAVQIGAWLQQALVTGKQIRFDNIGRRIEPVKTLKL